MGCLKCNDTAMFPDKSTATQQFKPNWFQNKEVHQATGRSIEPKEKENYSKNEGKHQDRQKSADNTKKQL